MNQTATPLPIAQVKESPNEFQPHRASLKTYVNQSSEPTKAIESFGRWIAKSGMFGCTREEQGMVIIIACIEMGIGLVEFSQTFDIMHNGKLRKKALAAQVEFENLGGTVRWIDCGENRQTAEVELTFKGQSRTFKFTLDDAKRAKVFKTDGAWETWTADMLCARALSRGISRMCPRVYAGFESDYEESPSAIVLPKVEEVLIPAPQVAQPAATVPQAPQPETQPAPVSAATTTTTVTPSVTFAPADGLLSVEDAENLAMAIGAENVVKAVTWMQKQQPAWLTKEQVTSGEPFRYLTPKRVARIVNQKDAFIRAINNPSATA
jgi:hypothetical protein